MHHTVSVVDSAPVTGSLPGSPNSNTGDTDMEAHEDELGPIDVVVIGYPPGAPMRGEAVPILLDLVNRGIVRVLDALVVRKDTMDRSLALTPPTWIPESPAT